MADPEAIAKLEALSKEIEDLHQTRQQNSLSSVQSSRLAHAKIKDKLKSDIEKCSKFKSKIKGSSEQIIQCIAEASTLNLYRYISEIVASILDTSYKAGDVGNIIKLIMVLHVKYDDFTNPLITGLKSSLLSVEENADKMKRRIQIRVVIELYLYGVFTEDLDPIGFFNDLLRLLLGKPLLSKTKIVLPLGKQSWGMDLPGLGTFLKYGSECLCGYIPKKVLTIATQAGKNIGKDKIPSKTLLPENISKDMRQLVDEVWSGLCTDLTSQFKKYRKLERKNEKDKLIFGDLTEEKIANLEQNRKIYESLLSSVMQLAEAMGVDPPSLDEEKSDDDEPSQNKSSVTSDTNLYGDHESKSFYTELPDILEKVPKAALGISDEQLQKIREGWSGSNVNNETLNDNDGDDDDTEDAALEAPIDTVDTNAAGDAATGSGDASSLNYEEKLMECSNKQKADEFSISFCFRGKSKDARNKLVGALLRIPWNRVELTATYARIIATISRIWPDIVEPILTALRGEFHGIFKTKRQYHPESKIKNVRYIAELVKFGVAPPIFALKICQKLLDDFTNMNVEMLAAILESCGRYLYLLPPTHERMEHVVETMLRLRRVKNLDVKQQNLLENAYFCVKPPDRGGKEELVSLSQAQSYSRFLIHSVLDKASRYSSPEHAEATRIINSVIKCIRSLPWNDVNESIELHLTTAILKAVRTKFVSIPYIADCLSGLKRWHPNLITRVVDNSIEYLQHALDAPHKREAQSLFGLARFLGELYNYNVLSATFIFDILYHVINFGHNIAPGSIVAGDVTQLPNTSSAPNNSLLFFRNKINRVDRNNSNIMMINELSEEGVQIAMNTMSMKYDPRVPYDLDPPNDFFRAQIVCEILNCCGSYYVKGELKTKLSRFLVYFQQYLFVKKGIPSHVEFTILDTFDKLEDLAKEQSRDKTSLIFPRFENLDATLSAIKLLEGIVEEEMEVEIDHDDEGSAAGSDDERDDAGTSDDGSKNAAEDDDQEIDSDEESDEESDEGSDDGSEDEKEARRLQQMRQVEEDEEFEKAFKAVMSESNINSRGVAVSRADSSRMAIPVVIPKPKNLSSLHEDGDNSGDDSDEEPKPKVVLKLLSRDSKGRVEARQLAIPTNSQIVMKIQENEVKIQEENRKLKEKVLKMSQSLTIADDVVDTSNPNYFQGHEFVGTVPSQAANMNESTSGRGGGRFQNSGGRGGRFQNSGGRGGRGRDNGDDRGKGKHADSLNLDQFLQESAKAEMKKITENLNKLSTK